MRTKLLALASATVLVAGTSLIFAADAANQATGRCTDGGGHVWQTQVYWGDSTATNTSITAAGFKSTAADATTVDYTITTYGGNGAVWQTLDEQDKTYTVGSWFNRNPSDPPVGPTPARVVINVGDGNDGKANCSVTFIQPSTGSTPAPTPTSAAPTVSTTPTATTAADPVVAAVGDVACAPGVAVTTSTCQQKAVGAKILADNPAALLALGDLQYQNGTAAEFKSYDAAFGPLKSRTKPVPGNHEYNTSGASGYYGYFGALAGDPAKGYYSFDIGEWHFVALNSERDITATGAQVAWLKADLAANSKNCVGAIWHKPRWSTGAEHGDYTGVQPFIDALYAAKADLILNGHDHDYERFQPLNPAGQVDVANGLTQIVSGLGGRNRYAVAGRATTAAKNSSTFGYTRLTLHRDSVDISYRAAVGTYTDNSTLTCHSDSPTPTASTAVPESPTEPLAPSEPPTPSEAAPTATPSAPLPATEAAVINNWGTPFTGDEFNYSGPPDSTKWAVFNSAGHAGKGLRRPEKWQVTGEYARVTGDEAGTTGGMSLKPDRGSVYGRWETRMRVGAGRDSEYHPVLIVWPDVGRVAANKYQEIDYAESTTGNSQVKFFLHYGPGGTAQTTASKTLDMTDWHNYAVEWTPDRVTGYIDGVKWFEDRAADHIPRDPSHQTLQLDWFPDGTTTAKSYMDVDWVRVYRP